MENSSVPSPASRAPGLTRTLCVVILLLMIVAAAYGATMAIRYFGAIGV